MKAEPEHMRFFVGMHQPSDAGKVEAAFVSVNRLKKRKSGFDVGDWIMDSGAFSTILTHGGYPEEPEAYAAEIRRWSGNGNLLAAVAQDYMCEAHMLAITGKTIEEHQQLTIERYDRITACDTGGVYVMPVLQGYAPADYVRHMRMYGDRLQPGMWVGVGSVCKRNGDPSSIEEVLLAIKRERPDLLLHGFGVKTTALQSGLVRDLLHTADSMAWSFAARKQGRDGNSWKEAARFADRIETMPVQHSLLALQAKGRTSA
ncbi:DUF7221 family queuine tRNA-ribosyltransferase-like protein [Azospirillum brasilense]|uniref:deazapurine DNA modification protein DpdA family protein n=1 Tax=Azospirillum brasilense TaxID=192 RepID=UPI000FF5FF7A|nr:hypothetical protein [Azospirillum brasilense]NUB28529.1 hypothetical protein [Azospirillum brasilense]NUB35696.1 hypothetical protein [Azospirillum brasilense]RIV96730.1 hypothetical protein D2T81_30745 [Azospirillum brasilense]